MTRASIPTLLSTDRWARILGLNPVHFSGAVGSIIWPDNGACEDIWPQHSWQTSHELVGREDVNIAIASAEEDIKRVLSYSAAPTWETEESHSWLSLPSSAVVQTQYGKVIAGGQRGSTLIAASQPVVRSDPDGDSWAELATVTVAT